MNSTLLKWAATAAAMMMYLLAAPAWAQEAIDQTRAVDGNERISVNVMRGNITIRGTDENEFRVVGTLDELAEGYELESSGGFTRFEVKMPRRVNARGNDAGSQLEIFLPKGAELEFETVNGNVDAQGLTRDTDIAAVNGNIVSRDLQGRVSLGTVNGRIDNQNGSGRLSLSTVNGRIEDNGSDGRVNYETVNGTVTASFDGSEVKASSVNGQLRLSLPNAQDIDLQSVNGAVEVEVGFNAPRIQAQSVGGNLSFSFAEGLNARVNVQLTAGGSIRNGVSDDEDQRPQFGPGRRLQFTRGEGEGSVNISSVNGNVRLQ